MAAANEKLRKTVRGGRRDLFLFFAGEAGGILMRLFAEPAFQAAGERDRGFSKFIPQAIGGGHSFHPTLPLVLSGKLLLRISGLQTRGINSQQPHRPPGNGLPTQQVAYLLENFSIEL